MEIGLGTSNPPMNDSSIDPSHTLASDHCELNFYVDGVRCAKCVQRLESLSTEYDVIRTSQFEQGRRLLKIQTRTGVAPQSIIQWIKNKGYEAHFIEQSAQEEELRKKSHRQWLLRLAITFFFASNLMMFAIALYMGAFGEWKVYFSWACGVFYLPILTYSALPFYRSAWQATKEKRFSADLAIVIAFGWGSALSYFNLLRGSQDFYFDSTASFLFLILLARFLLDKAQQSLESDLNPSLLFKDSPQFIKVEDVDLNGVELNDTDLKRPDLNRSDLKGAPPETLFYHQIKKNERLKILINQTTPVDMEVLSPAVEMDLSLFSGESLPQTFFKGDTIKAGMTLASESLLGRALGSFEETELHQIFKGVIAQRHAKTKAHSKAEAYSQRLLLTVSLLSLGLSVYWGLHGQWAEGFRRALALFTIACPCALALAIPLASVMTLKRAMERKLFVRSPLFFERLRDIRGIAFDKTGTLTEGHLELSHWEPAMPSLEDQQILLSMEAPSQHPIARSLTHWLKAKGVEPVTLDNHRETAGVGVDALYKGHQYRVHRIEDPIHRDLTGFQLSVRPAEGHPINVSPSEGDQQYLRTEKGEDIKFEIEGEIDGDGEIDRDVDRDVDGDVDVNVNVDGDGDGDGEIDVDVEGGFQKICEVYFKDQVRPEAPSLVDKLKKFNLAIHLLSGDRPEVVEKLANELNIPLENCHSRQSPSDKAQFFNDQRTDFMMVGDGHNDALALSRAPLSMAVKGSAETSLRAADCYSQRNSLNSILTAFELSRFYHQLIRQNIALSLVYNTIAGTMAIMGLVDPLMAAVLMPLNSFVVIGATLLAQPQKTKQI